MGGRVHNKNLNFHVFVVAWLIRNFTSFLTLYERLAKQSTMAKECEILFDMIFAQGQK